MNPGDRCTRVAGHKNPHDHDPSFHADWRFYFGTAHQQCEYVEPATQLPDFLHTLIAQTAAPPPPPLITRLRAAGWMVAVHNDYRQDGKLMTFWLFVRDGVAVKGEGATDDEALTQVLKQVEGR